MQKRKSTFSRPKPKPSGTKLTWNPISYDAAVETVRQFNNREPQPGLLPQQVEILYDYLARAASLLGGLECPAPAEDQTAQFQISLVNNFLVIQRRENSPIAPWIIYDAWLNVNPEIRNQIGPTK
jgi:hypothetical protein